MYIVRIMRLYSWLMILPPKKKIFRAKSRCYVAPTGTGKSTYMSVLANRVDRNKELRKIASDLVSQLVEGGYKSLRVPYTLSVSDTTIKLLNGKTTIRVNPYLLQIPNAIDLVQRFCPCTHIFVDEPYKYWNNRSSAQFPERVESWFRTNRHAMIDISMFYQEKSGVELKIRDCFNEFNIIKDMKIKYYLFRKDKEGFRAIKRVDWVIWQYYDYDTFIREPQPLSKWEIFKLKFSIYNPLMWFPFNIIDYSDKHRYKLQVLEILQNAKKSKLVIDSFRGDPFNLFDSHYFFPSFYRPDNVLSPKEYRRWARSLRYACSPNRVYSRDIWSYYMFARENVLERPETFTRMQTAKNVIKRQEKERQKEILKNGNCKTRKNN